MKGFSRKAYTLPAMSVTTIDFNGVNPNYFRVNNGGNARIYGGVISLPTPKLYDFSIEPNQVRMFCTDKGYPKLYLYNSSGSPANVIVTSFIEAFSPEVLAFADFNTANNEEQTLNVEIGGFTQSLPTGQNHIGKVTVNQHPDALYSALAEIKDKIGTTTLNGDVTVDMSATNSILDMILAKIPADTEIDYTTLLAEIRDKISEVGSSAGTAEVETHLFSHDGDISYGEYWSRDMDVREVVFMANDGEADIMLTLFDKGQAVTMTLKPGEVINHITGKFTSIGVDTSTHSVTIPYRLVFKYV